MNNKLKPFLIVLFLLSNLSFGQIKITLLPKNQNGIFDSVFFDKNEYRNVEVLNDGWKVYHEDDPQSAVLLSAPAVFEGEESLVFEKKISLTNFNSAIAGQNSQLILGFLGLNYSAEISINGYNIYKHSGGYFPFEIPIPEDILKENSTITIKVNRKLDSENSIPAAQRFLFPNMGSGIIRDVYLKTVSPVHITHNSFTYSFDQTLTKAFINFKIGIGNSALKKNPQSEQSNQVLVRINLFPNSSAAAQVKGDFVQIISSEDNEARIRLELPNPLLWSPQTPNNYLYEVSLIRDGQVIDKSIKQIAFYQLKMDQNDLLLNGNTIALHGTTYFLDETSLRRMNAYQKIREDLTLIKNTGFNAVRFAKSYSNPYALKLCQELGLFALIELPINSIPEEILLQNEFQLRATHTIKEMISNYSEYGNTMLIGVGSSFLPNSEVTQNFVSRLSSTIKEKGFFTYASFVGTQTSIISNLDFYGIELYSPQLDAVKEQLQRASGGLSKNSVFISEVSYPNYKGSLDGYLTKNSSDSQAKYFREIINLAGELKISGFFINSLLDYKGAFASLYGGYSENNIYKFGVLDYSRNLNGIVYKVLSSKLKNNFKVTIPIGKQREDNPIIFILLSLALSMVMAVLINTKKKFREDCTRALMRPYNFFADIRDRRIMPGIHTAILTLIQAGSAALLVTVLLFYLRNDILFEKILLAFGHHSILRLVSYLAWNPQICFVVLFIIFALKFALLAAVLKFASLFIIKTRVDFPAIFYCVVWSFLPLSLLLPIELILYKILMIGNFNTAIILFFVFYFLWLMQRILKGIYVIFDVRPLMVYLYSFAVIVLAAGGILLKYQLTGSAIYYISNAIKQYRSMIF